MHRSYNNNIKDTQLKGYQCFKNQFQGQYLFHGISFMVNTGTKLVLFALLDLDETASAKKCR